MSWPENPYLSLIYLRLQPILAYELVGGVNDMFLNLASRNGCSSKKDLEKSGLELNRFSWRGSPPTVSGRFDSNMDYRHSCAPCTLTSFSAIE